MEAALGKLSLDHAEAAAVEAVVLEAALGRRSVATGSSEDSGSSGGS